MKEFFKSDWIKKLIKIVMYACVEVLASTAFIALLKDRINDQLIYAIVIVITVQIANAIKKMLGEEHIVSKML